MMWKPARHSNRLLVTMLLITVLGVALTAGCQPGDSAPAPAAQVEAPAEAIAARALRLARETLIVDTHVDVPYRLFDEMQDISVRTEKGDFDYPRARAGGLDAPFMSIYVPADLAANSLPAGSATWATT